MHELCLEKMTQVHKTLLTSRHEPTHHLNRKRCNPPPSHQLYELRRVRRGRRHPGSGSGRSAPGLLASAHRQSLGPSMTLLPNAHSSMIISSKDQRMPLKQLIQIVSSAIEIIVNFVPQIITSLIDTNQWLQNEKDKSSVEI